MDLNIFLNKKAVILGGTKGAGLETAKLLGEKGAEVLCFGRTVPSEKKDNITFIQQNFECSDIAGLYEEKLKTYVENADILVYAAGPFVQKPLEETLPEEWQKMALLNYALPGICVSGALKYMKKNNFGRIIIFGGTRTDSVHSYKTNAAYAGAKTGLSVLIKSTAAEYGKYGITCNGVLPGFTHSAPCNTQTVSEKLLAENALYLMEKDGLNGVLLNVDRGWNP